MITLIALLLAAAPGSPDPLGEAHAGKQQCYVPNTATRRCAALASYAFKDDGSIDNKAVVMINAAPLVVMTAVDPVRVKNGAVCGTPDDLPNMTLTFEGQPASAALVTQVRAQILSLRDSMGMNGETCTTYTPDGDSLKAEITVAGKARPELTRTVIWVSPSDGYTVGP